MTVSLQAVTSQLNIQIWTAVLWTLGALPHNSVSYLEMIHDTWWKVSVPGYCLSADTINQIRPNLKSWFNEQSTPGWFAGEESRREITWQVYEPSLKYPVGVVFLISEEGAMAWWAFSLAGVGDRNGAQVMLPHLNHGRMCKYRQISTVGYLFSLYHCLPSSLPFSFNPSLSSSLSWQNLSEPDKKVNPAGQKTFRDSPVSSSSLLDYKGVPPCSAFIYVCF